DLALAFTCSLFILKPSNFFSIVIQCFFQLWELVTRKLVCNCLRKFKSNNMSATTEAAGTAQESERSILALNGSFDSISTLCKGLYNVGIGFITPLTTNGIPLVIPPSKPPSLFVFL